MAARFLQHADRGLELELVQEYPYESFGHTALTPEPGIDVPEGLGSTAYPPPTTDYSSPRRMTGEPGIDIWEQRDVDEDLDSIFLSKDFVASDAVRSPRKSREDPRRLKPESVSGKGDVSIDWREVAEALKAYASEQTDTPDLPPEAQAIWQNLLQSIGSTAGDSEDRL
ncbi:hypothetical protein QFC19_006803 [Naganishia cerealis]|uniref:Uncharacterized protein n=1 Tax=Naganishia cerealis TaxID=610337 RepID=A0ACC2VDH8_9TREE|nr:hypothetical protein QFC19_006803 [Naganishia cerealis]